MTERVVAPRRNMYVVGIQLHEALSCIGHVELACEALIGQFPPLE